MDRDLLPGLEKALRLGGNTHTLADIADMAEAGYAQIHTAKDAVIVTQIHNEPQKKVVHFWLASGDLEPVVELSHRVLDWAKGIGCTQATLAGRKGWEKVLASDGWRPMLTVMGREIG
jgi:hypothetical protein